uniref:Flagellar hook-basal body complex protein FliE n=1 Tax=Ammonifex degensii TaxID=42838 RepID=A0A7C2EKC5_9THEO
MEVSRIGSFLGPIETKTQKSGAGSFGEVLSRAIKEVNAAQVRADEAIKAFLSGETKDLHQVVLATEEAKLMLELAVQVRNKVVEAYQEISRMQI